MAGHHGGTRRLAPLCLNVRRAGKTHVREQRTRDSVNVNHVALFQIQNVHPSIPFRE